MKITRISSLCLITALLVLTMPLWAQSTHGNEGDENDYLFIGDDGDNTVKRFDANTGAYLGVFVQPGPASGPATLCNTISQPVSCLVGPMGLIFDGEDLLVSNQNVNLLINGEILKYDGQSGAFLDALVPYTGINAPPAPRGIILNGERLFVASLGGNGLPNDGEAELQAFHRKTGKFLGTLESPPNTTDTYHPRGIVIGPDGLLYVSSDPVLGGSDGQIFVFNPRNRKFLRIFASSDNCGCDFNRPEGLVFGLDGNLYVTSFAKKDPAGNPITTDKILIFAGPTSGTPGAFLDQIEFDVLGQPRASAQAILFGPGGKLFAPILQTGEVRRYNVFTKTYDVFGPTPPVLLAPFYLTFGKTNPTTLEYGR